LKNNSLKSNKKSIRKWN